MCSELNVAKCDKKFKIILSFLTLCNEISNLIYTAIKGIDTYCFTLDSYANIENKKIESPCKNHSN